MYRTKLILLAALVISASLIVMQGASAAVIQKTDAGGMMYMDKLTKALNLTPDQVGKIQAIHKDAKAQRDAVLSDQSLTRDQKKAKLMDLHKSKHERVTAVLTPDQRTKYEQFVEKHKAQWKDRMSELNLTPDQQAKIKVIREDSRKQLEALRANTSLSAEAKKAQMKEIFTATREKTRQLLTPEQRAKFDAARNRELK